MVSFEIFVKSMQPSLLELKVTPSFCFPFKIPDDPTATIIHTASTSGFKKLSTALHTMQGSPRKTFLVLRFFNARLLNFLLESNDFKLFGLASSLVSLLYVCGRVPRQLQNAAYIPSYHDIGKLWRGSVSMTESEGSELVRWQRKATVVTYTAKGFQASIWS